MAGYYFGDGLTCTAAGIFFQPVFYWLRRMGVHFVTLVDDLVGDEYSAIKAAPSSKRIGG